MSDSPTEPTSDSSPANAGERPQSYKRKKIFIHPQLQTRIMRDSCTAPMVGLSTGMLVLCFLIGMVRAEALESNVILGSLDKLTAAMLLFMTACLTVVIYHGLHFSHRIAGPLYRFRVTLDEVLAGGAASVNIRLRKKDYMHGLANHLNEVIGTIADRDAEIARLKALVGEAESSEKTEADSTAVEASEAQPEPTTVG